MSYAKVHAAGISGVTGVLVEVEADVAMGMPQLVVSGLPDAALHEARDRVRAAVVNAGEEWPQRRMTVNLRPATVRKQGSSFDLGIAVAILGGAGRLPLAALDGVALIGELGLDGMIRPVRGVLPMVMAAARAGLTRAIVPEANAAEAALVPGVRVKAAASLNAVMNYVRDGVELPAALPAGTPDARPRLDLADVVGQEHAKVALEVAAAGGHHLSLLGPPGAGKTMLAARLPGLLPPLDDTAALEVTSLYSIAGRLAPGAGLIRQPPFQAPHHTTSTAALLGGGTGLARPGAISLAHRGVLFLDELPEFSRSALEALRQPLEEGSVRIGRSKDLVSYPSRVQLVTAANPCPCAKPGGDSYCECSPTVRRRYLGRLSGPLMDRIDLRVELFPVTSAGLFAVDEPLETTETVGKRVVEARNAAAERWRAYGWRLNAEASRSALRLAPAATADLRHRIDTGLLSARGYIRVLRVAWTLADLAGRDRPVREDVATALTLRLGDIR
ncbi:MAG: YifB family Mg chelatase-like AAA ATPase [Hamadaea sp.]|uniref:YifB family Mg chelatase-like AAA ATPase n=1 Tax=Hamadaea sp. TaxID=2024425 RepID=UPI0017B72A4F|nr:YifB family Mg chelatase-like AAA ATPase [Hamadaea sp.]NUR70802.1 YifB family Mg chelatase-like AAA ATPase [Hamadaea sp.]NUT20165.1 YifB family Mg chelatase-like AAA ATPase [Hamadaea sp.]